METWERRDRPLLEAIIRRLDQGYLVVVPEEVQADTGLREIDVRAGLRALADAKLIGVMRHLGGQVIDARSATGEARRLVGAWPSKDPGEAFVAALERAIEATTDPGRRTRLTRLRDASVEVGTKVLGEVLAKLAAGAAG